MRRANRWLKRVAKSDFAKDDARVIVPVLYSADASESRNWAVLGVRLLRIKAYYARPPRIGTCYGTRGETPTDEQIREVTLGREPLTRSRFRSICSMGETKAEILDLLSRNGRRLLGLDPYVFYSGVGLLVIALALSRMRKRRAAHRVG